MNLISSAVTRAFSAAGDSFYAYSASRNATEERQLTIIAEDETKNSEVNGGIWDTITGVAVKVFPQTFFTMAFSMQLHRHLITIGASEGALTVSSLAMRSLPSLPLFIAVAPIIGFMMGSSGNNAGINDVVENGVAGMKFGRSVQKIGGYLSRALEVSFGALLISRVVLNDGRIGAIVGLATMIAGIIYRYELLNNKLPSAGARLDRVFTWKPNPVPYALGGAALIAGPTRPMAIFMLFYQGMRDLFLVARDQQKKNESERVEITC